MTRIRGSSATDKALELERSNSSADLATEHADSITLTSELNEALDMVAELSVKLNKALFRVAELEGQRERSAG